MIQRRFHDNIPWYKVRGVHDNRVNDIKIKYHLITESMIQRRFQNNLNDNRMFTEIACCMKTHLFALWVQLHSPWTVNGYWNQWWHYRTLQKRNLYKRGSCWLSGLLTSYQMFNEASQELIHLTWDNIQHQSKAVFTWESLFMKL